jgi:AcrR family transcriptional regulator
MPDAQEQGKKKTGRSPGVSNNQEAILEATRSLFLEKGYDGTTIRGIAAIAGVDPALVHHFFGSKEKLLLKVMERSMGTFAQAELGKILEGGKKRLGENLLRFVLAIYDESQPGNFGTLVGLIRSASSRPEASEVIREIFLNGGLSQIVASFKLSQPELRIGLVASEICGLLMARFVVKIEPLASIDPETLARLYAPAIQHYLTDPLI